MFRSASIEAIFRQVDRKTVKTGSNHEFTRDEDVLPLKMYQDRTFRVPRHTGRNIFPCHPLFNRLVRLAHQNPPRLCIRDDNSGVEATHLQLLSDVLAFRERVWKSLDGQVRRALEQRREVYIAILAPGGYEYAVAVLAALAIGAAIVPMTIALPAEQAMYYIEKSKSVAVLAADGALPLGLSLEKTVRSRDPQNPFICIPIAPSIRNTPLHPTEIIVSSDLFLDDNMPGVVIFTSGTTGPPKGAVMRRAFVHDEALAVAGHYDISSRDVLLHILPVHHATGIGIMFFPFLIAGALLEFKSGSFDAEWVWDRLRAGGITFFSGVPTIYMRMMRYFQQDLASRSDVEQYVRGARGLRACICGTSALPKPIADFWTELLGQRILLRYGATEIGAVIKVHIGDANVPDGSVGKVFASCDLRLSEGTEGEILVKSPGLFRGYLLDPEATAAAHDEDGYFKTGDIARRVGDYFHIMGRASVDIIKSGGYKVSALDVERELLALDYVAEAAVFGVPDLEFGQRVAAAVLPKGEKKEVTLGRLRRDLRLRLAGYQTPTVLRVVELLPKNETGKVMKKVLGPELFPSFFSPEQAKNLDDVQVWNREEKSHAKPKL